MVATEKSGGFPCQAFSYAGRKLGFEDTRGTLFFEFSRAIREIKPKIFLGENVRGLYQHDSGRTIETIISVLEDSGYYVFKPKILKAIFYQVPQKQTERCHPEETRPLTVREYARIQTFPDDWQFKGSTASQYKQIGNAVPVNLAHAVGRSLVRLLNAIEQDSPSSIYEEDLIATAKVGNQMMFVMEKK